MGLDAVLFDWGGTITAWQPYDHPVLWRRVSGALTRTAAEADDLAARLLAAEDATWRRSRSEGCGGRIAGVCETAGVPFAAVEPLLHDAVDHHTHTVADAAATLAGLRERGLAVGLLSNTLWPRAWHDGYLARDGILDAFDATVYSCEIGHAKPHPQAFAAALAAVGAADPSRAVYVGDRPYDDVAGAAAAGMRTVLVPHSDIPAAQLWGEPGEPDATVDRLLDILPVVDDWLTD